MAQMAAPGVSWRGERWENEEGLTGVDVVLLNNPDVDGVSPHTALEPILRPLHIPHWHKQTFDYVYASDCWRPTVGINGEFVLYAACGFYFMNFMMLKYRIDANTWDILYSRPINTLWTCAEEGGAAVDDPVYCFHNWKEDVVMLDGEVFSGVYSNQAMATWVIDNRLDAKTLNYTNWPGTNRIPGRNKVACNAAGLVAVIVEDPANWEVHVSTDFGVAFAVKKQIAYTANKIDSGLVIDENDDIFIFHYDSGTKVITCERSENDGATWATPGTITGVFASSVLTRMECSVEGASLYVSAEDGLGVSKFWYSTDAGVSWAERNLTTGRLFYMAEPSSSELYNMEDKSGVDQRTLDYTDSPPDWVDGAGSPDADGDVLHTDTDRGYLKNSGMYGVHSNRYSLSEAVTRAEDA